MFGSAWGVMVSVLEEAPSSSKFLERDDLDDLEEVWDGIVAGEGGVEVLDSTTAGLGFARLREPMAQIEHGEVRLLYNIRFCFCRVGRRRCRRLSSLLPCALCCPPESGWRSERASSWLQPVAYPVPRLADTSFGHWW